MPSVECAFIAPGEYDVGCDQVMISIKRAWKDTLTFHSCALGVDCACQVVMKSISPAIEI